MEIFYQWVSWDYEVDMASAICAEKISTSIVYDDSVTTVGIRK